MCKLVERRRRRIHRKLTPNVPSGKADVQRQLLTVRSVQSMCVLRAVLMVWRETSAKPTYTRTRDPRLFPTSAVRARALLVNSSP